MNVFDFFNYLHRGGEYAYYWALTAYSKRKKTLWFAVGEYPAIPQAQGINFYFGVHPTTSIPPTNSRGEQAEPRGVRAQLEYIAAVNCLFAEFDGKLYTEGKLAALTHAQEVRPAPSVIVDSGGGYHAYWLLRDTFIIRDAIERSYIKNLQARWVAMAGADKGSKDLCRVLRIPGTINYKAQYGPDFPTVHFHECNAARYTIAELTAYLPPIKVVTHRKIHITTHTDKGSWAKRLLDRISPRRAENYEDWVMVGMCLAGLGEVGLSLWISWSQHSGKFHTGECEKKWLSFGPAGRTLGTLYHLAKQDNYG